MQRADLNKRKRVKDLHTTFQFDFIIIMLFPESFSHQR